MYFVYYAAFIFILRFIVLFLIVSLLDFGFNVISFLKNNWILVYFLCPKEFKLHRNYLHWGVGRKHSSMKFQLLKLGPNALTENYFQDVLFSIS